MRELKVIEQELAKIEQKKRDAFDLPTIEQYMAKCEELWEMMAPLIFERDSQRDPVWREMSKYGHLMTLDDFIDQCECGGFIDYDGSGVYSNGKEESNISIIPSMVKDKMLVRRPEFTHVVWFNR